MSDARTAAGFDRLPWLADEPQPTPAKRGSRGLILTVVAALAIALIAGAVYWIMSSRAPEPLTQPARLSPSATVAVPEATPVQPEVQPEELPQVELPVLPTVPVPRPAVRERHIRKRPAVVVHRNSTPLKGAVDHKAKESTPASAVVSKPPTYPTLWPSRVSAGASGRLVQIGAFGTRYQAKRGWWAMVRAYPALKRLPTVVNDARNSKGRVFYRLQIGTTSQAHSEVLCQKMEAIHFSCAVVGLPGEHKAVER